MQHNAIKLIIRNGNIAKRSWICHGRTRNDNNTRQLVVQEKVSCFACKHSCLFFATVQNRFTLSLSAKTRDNYHPNTRIFANDITKMKMEKFLQWDCSDGNPAELQSNIAFLVQWFCFEICIVNQQKNANAFFIPFVAL